MKKIAIILFLVLAFTIVTLVIKPAFWPLSTSNPQISVENVNQPTGSGSVNVIKGGIMPFSLTATDGYEVRLFANNIANARDLFFTPQGVLLVSSPATGSVYALPDKDNNGVADEITTVVSGLDNPHGLAMYQGELYIAETKRVSRFTFDTTTYKATFEKQLFTLSANANHNKRTILFDESGNLYTSVGSTCNVCEETDSKNGTVLISNSDGGNLRVYSKGLRNAPFLAINPANKVVWMTGMGRDNLGDNLPPDEINVLIDKADYGWPYCYGDKVFDTNFNKKTASYCETTTPPLFQIPAHSAPLGLAFIPQSFSVTNENNLLVAYHGSWNRSVPDGYKVVMLSVDTDKISSSTDFLTGFIQDGKVLGRPVDVTFDSKGYLYISDDKAGNIYIVSKR